MNRPPAWVVRRVPAGDGYRRMAAMVAEAGLHTVCREARCPNIHECFNRGCVTFMILGDVCTRDCRFCGVAGGSPAPVDGDEPRRIAAAVGRLGLRYAVITSVTRDDLPDGGAAHFARTVEAIRAADPAVAVETLIPDFRGDAAALDAVLAARPAVVSHNVETVPSLYPSIRPAADYGVSLGVVRAVAARGAAAKSGFMLGLGETRGEVLDLMRDLRGAGCAYLVIGQYLRPTPRAVPVAAYVRPEEFDAYREEGLAMGFTNVAAGVFHRSSYLAEELVAPPAGAESAGR